MYMSQEVTHVKKEDLQECIMKLEERNLIVQHSSTSDVSPVSHHIIWQGQHVTNFKRFRKVIKQLFFLAVL